MPGPRCLMASFSSLLNEYAFSPTFSFSTGAAAPIAAVTAAAEALLIKFLRFSCIVKCVAVRSRGILAILNGALAIRKLIHRQMYKPLYNEWLAIMVFT